MTPYMSAADQILDECAPSEQVAWHFSSTHLSQLASQTISRPSGALTWQKMPSEQGVADLLLFDALVAIWAIRDPIMAAIGADIARLAGLALTFLGWGWRWRG